MKKSLLQLVYFVLFLNFSWSVKAQQTIISSFFQYNWQLQNPAAFDRLYIYDKHKNMMFNATYRNQWSWSGIEGAPENYSLSFENITASPGCRNCHRIKWGFNAFADKTDAISNIGVSGNFSYYIPVFNGRDKWLHFGLSSSLINYGVNRSKLSFKVDEGLTADINQKYLDFSLGIFYRHQKSFYLGLSIPQTFSLSLGGPAFPNNMNDDTGLAIERIQHVYMTIGKFINTYKRTRGAKNFTIEPALWLRYVPGLTFHTLGDLPLSADLSIRAYYNASAYGSGAPLFWFGTGYGTNRNLKFEVGITPQLFTMYGDNVGPDRIRLGFSWEVPIGTTGLNLGHALELNVVYAWNY